MHASWQVTSPSGHVVRSDDFLQLGGGLPGRSKGNEHNTPNICTTTRTLDSGGSFWAGVTGIKATDPDPKSRRQTKRGNETCSCFLFRAVVATTKCDLTMILCFFGSRGIKGSQFHSACQSVSLATNFLGCPDEIALQRLAIYCIASVMK